MEPKQIKKTLWVENGSGLFHLTDAVENKVRQALGNPDMLLVECSLDDLDQHTKNNYDCFILTVNRPDLIRYTYDKLSEYGLVLFVGVKETGPDRCDWKATSPCNTHYVIFDNLKVPVTQSGMLVGLEEYKTSSDQH